jgi:hypothetical protein
LKDKMWLFLQHKTWLVFSLKLRVFFFFFYLQSIFFFCKIFIVF